MEENCYTKDILYSSHAKMRSKLRCDTRKIIPWGGREREQGRGGGGGGGGGGEMGRKRPGGERKRHGRTRTRREKVADINIKKSLTKKGKKCEESFKADNL